MHAFLRVALWKLARRRGAFPWHGSRSRPEAVWTPLSGRLEAWGVVKHVLPAPSQIQLCWRHSAEAPFEAEVKIPADV